MTYVKPTKKRFRKLKLREKLALQQMQIKQLQEELVKAKPKEYWEKKGELFLPGGEP